MDKITDLYENIKKIKELINTQTSFIQEVINKPKKQRAKPKHIKVENRTLDLTITDTDIKKNLKIIILIQYYPKKIINYKSSLMLINFMSSLNLF